MNLPSVHSFTSVFYTYMGEPYAALLSGMVLGVDVPQSLDIYAYFKRTGLLHLVVLSGSNINFLVATCMRVCLVLGTRLSAIVSITVVVLFILFVGPEPPVVRAGLMAGSTLIAVVFNRQSIALATLLTTAVCIGVIKTDWLATISFQLSFGASLGIILWSPAATTKKAVQGNRLLHYIKDDMRTTLAAQVVTTPLIMYYFREISLIAPLSNLAVSFVTGPIMILGIVTLILGKLHYWLGYIPAKLAVVCLYYVCEVTRIMSSLPHVFIKF
ncbi:MAG: ComEC family competence protein [Microgenomates bacterium OLB23]|nr:MAG: ComEC family competence protein [Microgenomates bacterium OLB23]